MNIITYSIECIGLEKSYAHPVKLKVAFKTGCFEGYFMTVRFYPVD